MSFNPGKTFDVSSKSSVNGIIIGREGDIKAKPEEYSMGNKHAHIKYNCSILITQTQRHLHW